jgi:membrane-associated phospholipid phosphatase
VTVNTIVATMFLRWHYLIDVIAGLALAFGSIIAADKVVTWELARRVASDLPSLWPAWPSREAPHE